MDPVDRLGALAQAKLRGLIGASGAPFVIAGGAALVEEDRLWVYIPGDPARSLGRALAIGVPRGIERVEVVLDGRAGIVARRAALLTPPAGAWVASGRDLVAAIADPRPDADAVAGLDAAPLVALLRQAGAEVVIEHGVVSGEILGLQVARVGVDDAGAPRLFVGVGRFDQEATDVLLADLPPDAALARAIAQVRAHRRPGAAPHPVNRLARERWLRERLRQHPERVGLRDVEPIPPPEPRANVRDSVPAAALGRGPDDERVLLVCTVGVDLELVPFTADLVDRERPERVVFALPARDDLPVQRQLATRLAVPSTFTAVEGEWPQ